METSHITPHAKIIIDMDLVGTRKDDLLDLHLEKMLGH